MSDPSDRELALKKTISELENRQRYHNDDLLHYWNKHLESKERQEECEKEKQMLDDEFALAQREYASRTDDLNHRLLESKKELAHVQELNSYLKTETALLHDTLEEEVERYRSLSIKSTEQQNLERRAKNALKEADEMQKKVDDLTRKIEEEEKRRKIVTADRNRIKQRTEKEISNLNARIEKLKDDVELQKSRRSHYEHIAGKYRDYVFPDDHEDREDFENGLFFFNQRKYGK